MSSSNQPQQIASYSKAVSQPRNIMITPDREQAILFNTLENCTINDYLEGLSQHIEPRNIIFASRISNGRICIYLSSKNLVDKFIAETKKIKVNGNILEARRLITPSVRLILSGVCPSIPSNLIKDELINKTRSKSSLRYIIPTNRSNQYCFQSYSKLPTTNFHFTFARQPCIT